MTALALALSMTAAANVQEVTVGATVHDFIQSDAFVRVVHGPVGSGKSSACVLEILRRATEQAPNRKGHRLTRFAVVRNTYRELEDTTRKTFEQWLGTLGTWREKDFAFEISQPLEDGTRIEAEVLFRALDRPQDIKKLLSLEITGAYVNELRELPKAILDGLQMRVGRYPMKADGGATWSGVWADTNPWPQTSEYAELFAQMPEGFAIFRQPSGLGPDAENIENLPAGYYARMCAGKDTEWIAEYVEGRNPRADKGSIYGEWLAKLGPKVGAFEHPKDGVFASFDLGVSDSTAIWFWRVNDKGVPDVIDWYECSGEGAEHYFGVLRERGYEYEKIWLPHDARARTFQTGVSTLDLFLREFPGQVAIGPELGIADGIGAARWVLEQPIRIHERCSEGLKRLRAYRYEWDEGRKSFSRKPLHDWTSHTADAFRYVACVAKASELLTRKAETAAKPPARDPSSFSLDELWDTAPRGAGGRV